MGPTLIFDKSFLQGLSVDESVWLDQFFITNITPLFLVETLADLEKEIKKGRTPEDVVGNLAYKTPDYSSKPNVHHMTLLEHELYNGYKVDMRYGRPIVASSKTVEVEGQIGVVIEKAPEEEALERWESGAFLDAERLSAKAWREQLSNAQIDEIAKRFEKIVEALGKPKSLADVKKLAHWLLDSDPEGWFDLCLTLLNLSEDCTNEILTIWKKEGQRPLKEYAPYFRHVASVDLFFYFAMACNMISRTRPSHKADMAYLYYLPFCNVFVSDDKLHDLALPHFLSEHQIFIKGVDLKADLKKLDQHYSNLDVLRKAEGVCTFAKCPPMDLETLVANLWDKYLPKWRSIFSSVQQQDDHPEIIEKIERLHSAPASDIEVTADNHDAMIIARTPLVQKGKWQRFPNRS